MVGDIVINLRGTSLFHTTYCGVLKSHDFADLSPQKTAQYVLEITLDYWVGWTRQCNCNPPSRMSSPITAGWELFSAVRFEAPCYRYSHDVTIGINVQTGQIGAVRNHDAPISYSFNS